MIFLLNTERVLTEIVALTKIRVAEIIGGRPENIRVELEIVDGKLRAKFDVEVAEDAMPLEKETAEKACSEYWMGKAKPELIARMHGLREKRHGQKEAEADPGGGGGGDGTQAEKRSGEESATERGEKSASEQGKNLEE